MCQAGLGFVNGVMRRGVVAWGRVGLSALIGQWLDRMGGLGLNYVRLMVGMLTFCKLFGLPGRNVFIDSENSDVFCV